MQIIYREVDRPCGEFPALPIPEIAPLQMTANGNGQAFPNEIVGFANPIMIHNPRITLLEADKVSLATQILDNFCGIERNVQVAAFKSNVFQRIKGGCLFDIIRDARFRASKADDIRSQRKESG